MANLPKFHLVHNKQSDQWDLKNASNRIVDTFENKADATAGGVLSDAIGKAGGSVRIHKLDGTIQEERTFPRSADPKTSPG